MAISPSVIFLPLRSGILKSGRRFATGVSSVKRPESFIRRRFSVVLTLGSKCLNKQNHTSFRQDYVLSFGPICKSLTQSRTDS